MEYKKRGRQLLLAGMMAAVTAAGGIMAYFTDVKEADNIVTIGRVEIELTEDKWDQLDPEEKENITPNKTLEKDPEVCNVGKNKAFVFLEVTVPAANVVTANENGTRNPSAFVELFSYDVQPGWVQMETTEVRNQKDQIEGYRHLYAYGTEEECTGLLPGEKTGKLFSEITFANIIEGQLLDSGKPLQGSVQQIRICAHGIQTQDLTSDKVKDPKQVWKVYTNQNQ